MTKQYNLLLGWVTFCAEVWAKKDADRRQSLDILCKVELLGKDNKKVKVHMHFFTLLPENVEDEKSVSHQS